MKKFTYLLLMLFMSVTSMWAETLNLTPTGGVTTVAQDNTTSTYDEAATSWIINYGIVSNSALKEATIGSGGGPYCLVKFDASSIPAAATITKATISFDAYCTVSTKNSQLQVAKMSDASWDATSVVWSTDGFSKTATQIATGTWSEKGTTSKNISYDITSSVDKAVMGFAIYTSTGREHNISNIKLDIEYTTASTHNYTVNAVAGETVLKQIATGVAAEQASYSVAGLPYAIMYNGSCYVLSDENVSNYGATFTMGTTDETKTVSYTKYDGIQYFFEAENIRSKSYGDATGNYSGGAAAGVYSGANLTMSNIVPGTYTVTVNTAVRRTNEDKFTVQTSTDNTNWTDAGTITLTDSKAGNYSLEGVTLNTVGYIRLVEANSANQNHYIDYVLLTRTAGNPIVGAIDKSTEANAAVAETVTIKQGETRTFKFVNHGGTYGENWRILVKQGETWKSTTCADSYDYTADTQTNVYLYNENKEAKTPAANYSLEWNDYNADMANATCEATLKYGTDGTLNIYAISTGVTSGYNYFIGTNVTGCDGDLSVNLSVNKSWMEVIQNGILEQQNAEKGAEAWGSGATYTQNLAAGKYSTICLPYAATFVPTQVKVMALANKTMDGTTLTSLTFQEVSSMDAGMPYLVRAIEANPVYTKDASAAADVLPVTTANGFTGVYADTNVAAGDFFLYNGDATQHFAPSNGYVTAGAFRAFIKSSDVEKIQNKVNPAKASVVIGFDGDVTAINNIDAANVQEVNAQNGKFIKNGKLVIFKNGKQFNAAGAQMK